MKLAFHTTRKPENLNDGTPMKLGKSLKYYKRGSLKLRIDVLAYHKLADAVLMSDGNYLHLSEVRGEIEKDEIPNCVVRNRALHCSEIRNLLTIDLSPVFISFCNLLALNLQNMWPMPDSMKHYLQTGENRESAFHETVGYCFSNVRTSDGDPFYAITAQKAASIVPNDNFDSVVKVMSAYKHAVSTVEFYLEKRYPENPLDIQPRLFKSAEEYCYRTLESMIYRAIGEARK